LVPEQVLAQGGGTPPGAGQLPLEALQSKGRQSAVRILAYARVTLANPDPGAGGRSATREILNIGTGVRFGVSNRVLTARNVVIGADSIVVEVGQRRMPATLLGSDESTYLALLSVNDLISSNEPPGPSEAPVLAGDITLLVDPLQERTILHQGEIRTVMPTGFIFTTLPVYPGLSGAPLLNSSGELVGIVILQYVSDITQTGPGNAAAITVDIAAHVAGEIEAFGRVRWGWIGGWTDPDIRDRIILETVDPESPADLAGLRPGDQLTHYGGQLLTDMYHMRDLVRATVPGTAVPVKAQRDSLEIEVQLIVGDRSMMPLQQAGAVLEAAPTPDMFIVARFHALFEELNRLFSRPGFNPERTDVRSRIVSIERQLNELKRVSLISPPPGQYLP